MNKGNLLLFVPHKNLRHGEHIKPCLKIFIFFKSYFGASVAIKIHFNCIMFYTIYLREFIVITHYVNVSVLIKFSQKTSVFNIIIISSRNKHMFSMCIRIASVRRF